MLLVVTPRERRADVPFDSSEDRRALDAVSNSLDAELSIASSAIYLRVASARGAENRHDSTSEPVSVRVENVVRHGERNEVAFEAIDACSIDRNHLVCPVFLEVDAGCEINPLPRLLLQRVGVSAKLEPVTLDARFALDVDQYRAPALQRAYAIDRPGVANSL